MVRVTIYSLEHKSMYRTDCQKLAYFYCVSCSALPYVPLCNTYNIEEKIWQPLRGPKNTYRHKHTMLVMNEKLYLFGGVAQNNLLGPVVDTVLSYDPKTDKWKNEVKLIAPRAAAAGIVVQLPPPE